MDTTLNYVIGAIVFLGFMAAGLAFMIR